MKEKIIIISLAYLACAFFTCIMVRELIFTEHVPYYGASEKVLKMVVAVQNK
jgi:hypothetical protein